MHYILILDGKAHEIIPEFNPDLPGVPIVERYSPKFLSQCVKSDDPVSVGWRYDAETGVFSEPSEPEPEIVSESGDGL